MILAIIQARMSSTRLPGKVLMPLFGAPMIARQIERVSRSRRIDRLVVATSLDPSDDPLEGFNRLSFNRFSYNRYGDILHIFGCGG